MKKRDIKEIPSYYEYYINLNEDVSLDEAFEQSLKQIDAINIEQLKRIGLKVYAENKWTIHQIIQHIIDWERIWCYRTIVCVRREGTIPEGLEQDIMVRNANANELSLEQLLSELRVVRVATRAMFASFNPQMLAGSCQFYNYQMSAGAIGFSIIGHQIHHFNVIKERYMPLAQ